MINAAKPYVKCKCLSRLLPTLTALHFIKVVVIKLFGINIAYIHHHSFCGLHIPIMVDVAMSLVGTTFIDALGVGFIAVNRNNTNEEDQQ